MDPGGTRAAVVTPEALELWDVDTSQKLAAVRGLPVSGSGRAVAWHPDGGLLALSGAGRVDLFTDGLSPVWRTPADAAKAGEEFYVSDVAFSPGGELLAIGAWSKGFVIATPSVSV